LDYLEKAISNIWINRKIIIDSREIIVALLLQEKDWRIVVAPWWRKKQASIIGTDYSGNFILRLSSGCVVLWDHALQDTVEISKSVKEFVSYLEEDINALP
jgi:hypothetical protein